MRFRGQMRRRPRSRWVRLQSDSRPPGGDSCGRGKVGAELEGWRIPTLHSSSLSSLLLSLHPSLSSLLHPSRRPTGHMHLLQPLHCSGAAGAPEQWKWTFCHLESRRCHTLVSSDWLLRGRPWPSTNCVRRM